MGKYVIISILEGEYRIDTFETVSTTRARELWFKRHKGKRKILLEIKERK